MPNINNKIIKKILILTEDFFYKIPSVILKKVDINRNINKKQIVFILENTSTRAIKILEALKDKGYEIIVIIRYTNSHILDKQIKKIATKTFFCISPSRALSICLRYKPLCYHIFCCYRYDIAEHLIKNKVGKIVFDNYDGFGGFVYGYNKTKHDRKITAQEKYCLENADGLTCRSFETQYQKYKMGYKFKGKRILFLDYCGSADRKYVLDSNQENDNLKFIYCGGVHNDSDDSYCFSCNGEFAKIVARHSNIYTMYCSNYNENIHKTLIDLGDNLQGFKFCKPIPYDELKVVLHEYDYGVFIAAESRIRNMENSLTDKIYYKAKYECCSANKFFDYLEMGLPIIAKKPTLMVKIFKHYGVAYEATLETIESALPILRDRRDIYRKNIEKNINKLSMEYNIHRLIEFYDNI